jgi:hypothetical protein
MHSTPGPNGPGVLLLAAELARRVGPQSLYAELVCEIAAQSAQKKAAGTDTNALRGQSDCTVNVT